MSNTQELFQVASRASGQELFSQRLGPWFYQGLTARTAWIAVNKAPELAGKRVQVTVESLCRDGMVDGWNVAFSSGGQSLFQHHWPTAVLQPTALAVSQQYRNALDDARVLYWVNHVTVPRASGLGIEFESEETDSVTLPKLTVRSTGVHGQTVFSTDHHRPDAILELDREAYEVLTQTIAAGSGEDKELACAADTTIERNPEGALFYKLGTVVPLRSPDATAALCPIGPEELLGMFQTEKPFVFLHTHIVGEDEGVVGSHLACSRNDLRTFHRLPVGSLGIVAASRLPLRVRVYGWLSNGELSELSVHLTIVE